MDVSLAEQSVHVEREAVDVDDKLRAATPTSVIVQSEEQQESVDHELKDNGVGVLDVKEKDDTSDVKDSVDAQHKGDGVTGEVGPTIELSKQGHDSELIEGGDRPPDPTESSPPPATRQDPVSRESPHHRSSEQKGLLQLYDCVIIDPVCFNVYSRVYIRICIRMCIHMYVCIIILFMFRATYMCSASTAVGIRTSRQPL